MSDKREVIVR